MGGSEVATLKLVTEACTDNHCCVLFSCLFMQVKQMEDKLDGWSQDLDRLLLEHHWLLLFSLPKLLKLSKLLISAFQPHFDAKKIMHELGFLFRSDVKARKRVMGPIKVSVIAHTLLFTRCCLI